ncbi:hypothetical protein BC939DRAFT_317403 [Gamsiella multidivaricata]|uniref:uncharacterized protein n=1 Tax=Gamsiella multidivaricata TaxID=101098 RepID=UPI0022212413|nr:uncharacterized protein BC939DRAFT_317403 [Gamsiella multidivaricata]KAI7817731.1 hypothetical protein BC939DRAFT_317403 [Gamsiella multidivaricata]
MVESLLHIVGAWGAFGIMVAILLGFSVFFTLYYSDTRDREPFAMIITVLALTLCLSTVALFPVDIFLVSKTLDPSTGLRRGWATDEAIASMQLTVRIVYYGKERAVGVCLGRISSQSMVCLPHCFLSLYAALSSGPAPSY